MRILHVNDVGFHVGGAETNLFSIMRLFQDKCHEQFLFALRGGNDDIRDDVFILPEEKDSESSILKTLTYNLFDPGLYFNKRVYRILSQYIEKINPDVIHLHNNFLYTNPVLQALLDSGKPVVQSAHDYGIVCPTSWCVKKDGSVCDGGFGLKCFRQGCLWMKKFVREYFPRKKTGKLMREVVDRFICPSKRIQEKLIVNGFDNSVHIPYFIFPDEFNPAPELIEDGFILYVGVLFPQKGVDYLIEAMPQVVNEHPETALHVVGDGPEMRRLDEKAGRLIPKEKVIFHGRIEQDMLPEVYSKANVIVFPSIWVEQFGIVGLEAMASARPVVGSNIGGIPEWLHDGETGFLAKPRDPQDLSEKINKIIENKKLAVKMGRKGRKSCEEKFSADVVYPKLLEVYESVTR